MKDNAHHVPGSTGSRRRTFVFIRVDSWLTQSTYKTQTKCIQNRNRDFFNYSVSTTCNFNAVTCLNFADPKLNPPPDLNLNQPCARRLGPGHYPFSLGEKVRMRDKLVSSSCPFRALRLQCACAQAPRHSCVRAFGAEEGDSGMAQKGTSPGNGRIVGTQTEKALVQDSGEI